MHFGWRLRTSTPSPVMGILAVARFVPNLFHSPIRPFCLSSLLLLQARLVLCSNGPPWFATLLLLFRFSYKYWCALPPDSGRGVNCQTTIVVQIFVTLFPNWSIRNFVYCWFCLPFGSRQTLVFCCPFASDGGSAIALLGYVAMVVWVTLGIHYFEMLQCCRQQAIQSSWQFSSCLR